MTFARRALALLALASTVLPCTLRAQAYDAKPRLVIVLVFDQFRGDFLDRWHADFHAKNGWNLFLHQGAHFTDCYYQYGNLVTAAGHATIGTGAYTDGHGIPLNDWREPGPDGKLRLIQAIDDDRYPLVGEPTGHTTVPGVSPQRELATTLGDELELATGGKAKVFGVSLKDRAAVMTSGHATKGAYWVDHNSGAWITSTYWRSDLPAWVKTFNATEPEKATQQAHVAPGEFYERVGRTAAGMDYQFNFATELIKQEDLGHNPAGVTDLLTLSISSTDINGHAVGPDDNAQRALIDAADISLDRFFTFLDKQVGLANVLIAFTGDHGVADSPAELAASGFVTPSFSGTAMINAVETALEKRFPSKGEGRYIINFNKPYIQLNTPLFAAAGLTEDQAEDATRQELHQVIASLAVHTTEPARAAAAPEARVFTLSEMREGRLPATQLGHLVAQSYSPYIGWGLWLNFGAYQFPNATPGSNAATHYSAQSYDRHVPLDFFGVGIKPGIYHGLVEPVDIAATFASLLRINRPSAAVGHVRTEALVPEPSSANLPRR